MVKLDKPAKRWIVVSVVFLIVLLIADLVCL